MQVENTWDGIAASWNGGNEVITIEDPGDDVEAHGGPGDERIRLEGSTETVLADGGAGRDVIDTASVVARRNLGPAHYSGGRRTPPGSA